MIEDYDDSDERNAKADKKDARHPGEIPMSERYPIIIMPTAKPACPYCTAAKKGGAPGNWSYEDSKGFVHQTKVVREEPTGKMCMTIWFLQAACGAEFSEVVDSSD